MISKTYFNKCIDNETQSQNGVGGVQGVTRVYDIYTYIGV